MTPQISIPSELSSRLAAIVLATLPLAMFFSREIPPLWLAIAVVLALAGALRRQGLKGTISDVTAALPAWPLALLAAAVAYAVLSLAWSPSFDRGVMYLGQGIGSIVLVALALILLPSLLSPRVLQIGALACALTALLIMGNVLLDGEVRSGLGLDGRGFRINRATVAIVLLWPIVTVALLRWKGWRPAMAATVLTVAAALLSESESAKLALAVALVTLALARIRPRLMLHLACGGAVLVVLLAPLLFGQLNDLLPQAVHDAVGKGASYVRGEIWREYTALTWKQPLLGFGFAASENILSTPWVEGYTEQQRYYLEHVHPHSAPLQIWFELGAVGAVVTALLIAYVWRAIARLPDQALPGAVAAFAGVFAVACVSHGAWQAWWFALVGAVAVWVAAEARGQSGNIGPESGNRFRENPVLK